jgi:hypothetical protein
LDSNNSHGELGELQGWIVCVHSWYKHSQNALEQRHQHQRGAVHVPGYKQFLPDSGPQIFWVYENPSGIISTLDSQAIWPVQTPQGWLGAPGNEMSSMGITTGRDFGE